MEHYRDIYAFCQPLSYFRAAYVHKRRLDDVPLEFVDATAAPNGFEFSEVRALTTRPLHRGQIAEVDHRHHRRR